MSKATELLKKIEARERGAVKKFVDSGVNINSHGTDGQTALHLAIRYGDSSTKAGSKQMLKDVKMLLDAGADPNAVENKLKETPIYLAITCYEPVRNLESELVELLIAAGTNLKHLNKQGLTVLDSGMDGYTSNEGDGFKGILVHGYRIEFDKPDANSRRVLRFLVDKGAKTKYFKQAQFDKWLG